MSKESRKRKFHNTRKQAGMRQGISSLERIFNLLFHHFLSSSDSSSKTRIPGAVHVLVKSREVVPRCHDNHPYISFGKRSFSGPLFQLSNYSKRKSRPHLLSQGVGQLDRNATRKAASKISQLPIICFCHQLLYCAR